MDRAGCSMLDNTAYPAECHSYLCNILRPCPPFTRLTFLTLQSLKTDLLNLKAFLLFTTTINHTLSRRPRVVSLRAARCEMLSVGSSVHD